MHAGIGNEVEGEQSDYFDRGNIYIHHRATYILYYIDAFQRKVVQAMVLGLIIYENKTTLIKFSSIYNIIPIMYLFMAIVYQFGLFSLSQLIIIIELRFNSI